MKKPMLHGPLSFLTEENYGFSPPAPAFITAVIHAALPPTSSADNGEPPIFLSPFSISSPSPSPIAAQGHHSLSKAAIAGTTIGGSVVAVAVVATIASTVAGKAGLACLLGPLLKPLLLLSEKLHDVLPKLIALFHHGKGGSGKAGDDQKDGELSIDILGEADGIADDGRRYNSLTDPSARAQALLAARINEMTEELNKQKALIMQPLHQTAKRADALFEPLYSAINKASIELEVLQGSTHGYLHEVSTTPRDEPSTTSSAMIIAPSVEEINETSRAHLQRARTDPLLDNEGVVLSEVLVENGKGPYLQEEISNQAVHGRQKDARKPTIAIVQTPSDADQFMDEMDAIAPIRNIVGEQEMGSLAVIPNAATEGAIVPVPLKDIMQTPARARAPAAAPKRRRQWLSRHRHGKSLPVSLGHVSFSCEMSALNLHLFTSCRSGGAYGSPPPSYAGNDMKNFSTKQYSAPVAPLSYAGDLDMGSTADSKPQIKLLEHHVSGQQEPVRHRDNQNDLN